MKRSLKLILIALPLTLFSCNKWLDVEPKSQVRDSDLFSSETGFKDALAGVYSSLTYEPLYGKELTFGLMGVLGYEWDSQSVDYDFDKAYNYQSSQISLNRIDAIWNGLYNSVANTNKLLEEIDGQKSVFTGDNYNIIKGEALALRAFIHFDLLRAFGASYEENPQKLAIPYYKNSSKEIAPQLSVAAVIDLAIADLNEAAELLKSDPIFTGRTVTIVDDSGYLINRQVHLNFFAVKGLLARIYLYKKDNVKALENANVVIGSTKFPWILPTALSNKEQSDLTFSTEHLFALNVTRLKTIYDNSFTVLGTGNKFSLTENTKKDYYDNLATDFRYLYWFNVPSSGSHDFYKFYQSTDVNRPQAYRNKLPMIKLSEVYFIAAEAQKTNNITAAATMVNELRLHRGLTATTINATNFEAVLQQEFRKEFLGEGQLFFFHKRKNNMAIPRASGLNLITLKGYKFPIPISEFTNAPGRVDNR